MTVGNVFEHLPNILPEGTVRIEEEEHEFTVLKYSNNTESTKYEYLLDKAPVDRVDRIDGTLDGRDHTFVKGTDYQVIDTNGDGELDTIDWDVGGDQPDDNTDFFVTYVAESIVSRYVESHEEELDVTDVSIDDVIDSRQIDNANGAELDRIGSIFGQLGKRRNRADDEYRSFLKSIVQSFKGRGTVPGLRFAIAAGVGSDDPENDIIINEDFTQVGYTITIVNVDTSFITSAVNELAQLADPSGVELLQPPIIITDVKSIDIDKQESTATEEIGLGGGTLDLDGTKTLGGPN